MVKIQNNGSQFTVTIPNTYAKQAGYEKGTDVTVNFNERGNLELIKVKR